MTKEGHLLTLKSEEAVEILAYAPWDENNDRMGEFVRIRVPGEERTRRYTVDRSINGQRPAEGSYAKLTFAERVEMVAYNDREGRARNRPTEKRRVVAFSPAKEAA
jgi:hypothetical protein